VSRPGLQLAAALSQHGFRSFHVLPAPSAGHPSRAQHSKIPSAKACSVAITFSGALDDRFDLSRSNTARRYSWQERARIDRDGTTTKEHKARAFMEAAAKIISEF